MIFDDFERFWLIFTQNPLFFLCKSWWPRSHHFSGCDKRECCSNPKRLKLSKTLFEVPLRSCNCSRFRVEEKQKIVIFDDFGRFWRIFAQIPLFFLCKPWWPRSHHFSGWDRVDGVMTSKKSVVCVLYVCVCCSLHISNNTTLRKPLAWKIRDILKNSSSFVPLFRHIRGIARSYLRSALTCSTTTTINEFLQR